MTDMPAAAGSARSPGRAEPGLIHRHDLIAALNRSAQKRVTIISAPAGTGRRRCCARGRTSRVGIAVSPS
jgi:LuxR family transcriptional regulator, maltose regulon positive regulatory protein